jgi:hypothetical protein
MNRLNLARNLPESSYKPSVRFSFYRKNPERTLIFVSIDFPEADDRDICV